MAKKKKRKEEEVEPVGYIVELKGIFLVLIAIVGLCPFGMVADFIKNPILIKNSYNYEKITEKMLKQLILEDLDSFLKELGEGFCYIENEYKIKIGDRNNYIDLLLYNIKYNCFVVVELKVTELKKEYIGQIETYMNYVDKNIKSISQDKTIGIIICKKDNEFIMEYCSDDRIFRTTYILK